MTLLMKPVQTSLSTTTSATVDLTAPGLGTPKAAIIWSNGSTAKETDEDNARMSFGFFDGTNSFVTCCFDQHNVGTSVTKSRAKTGSVVMHIDGTSVVGEATATFITDGVRLTMSTGFSSAFLVTALLMADDGTGNTIDNVYVGTGTTSTYLTEVDNTDPGFQPELFFFAHGPEVANDTHEDNAQIGISVGYRSGTNIVGHGAGTWFSTHGLDTTSSVGGMENSRNSVFLNNSTDKQGALQILNIDSSGFSYRDVDTTAITFDFGYIVFAGSAFTNIWTDQYGLPVSTGDQSRTGVGFQPGCAFQVQTPVQVGTNPDLTNPLGLTISAFDSTTSYLQNIITRDNIGTADTANMAKDKVVFNQNDLTTLFNEATFVSFDADGWTLNYTTAVGSNAGLGVAFDSQEPVAPPAEEATVTATEPAGSRDTRLALADPPAGTTKTQWEITPSGESAFTIQTTESGTDSANVSDSDLQTLDIWLPPSHSYTLRTRHFTSGSWGAWSASSEFTSRGTLNSYEKYLALSGLGGVDNVETS